MQIRVQPRFDFIGILLAAAWVLVGAGVEFYQIAWGTGIWLGQFALTWFVAFILFVLFGIACLTCLTLILWQTHRLERFSAWLGSFRNRMGNLRWILAACLILLPVYLLQYTFWGIVVHGLYLRILLVASLSIAVGWLLSDTGFMRWPAFLVALLLMAAALALLEPFAEVTSYPFSLGWSEGNRLWDYSILFGRDRYKYPADQDIPVFLEFGRQFFGGIPFLLPNVNIWQVRFWRALVDVVPYLLLGWAAFRPLQKDPPAWLLAGAWAFLFVKQGPVHAPLLICAIVVALAWRRPLWLAVPLIFAAAYFAQATRFTWLFAPAMWSVMLEFASAPELTRSVWRRAVSVGMAGVLGGYVVPSYLPAVVGWIKSMSQPVSPVAESPVVPGPVEAVSGSSVSVSSVQSALSTQPLLWDRLFPNPTYGPGILFGLVLAVIPVIIVLVYLAGSGRWKLSSWQKASIILPLLAFLVVGLVVSVKIGGGGDLHNLDMFIIGLLFAAAIAWRNGGYEWIRSSQLIPGWVAASLIAMIALPAYQPLRTMRPLSVHADLKLVVTLADILPNDPLPDPLPDTIPADADTQQALKKLRKAVQSASASGEILFMDQRQLLTFGYVDDLPLVPDYDKKLLIDMAMSGNAAYFDAFYKDLASHRFSLIITNPVNQRLEREEGHFAEENNAWVTWVAKPLLCYYQPLDVLKKVDVELLVPQTGPVHCEDVLP